MVKIVDKFMMEIIPEVSSSETAKIENKLEKSTSEGVSKGFKKGIKKGGVAFGSFINNNKGKIAALAVGMVALATKAASDAISNIQQQIDIADTLATRAAQSGIQLDKFLRIQKILEFGDVEASVASDAIIEFSKRLGAFQKTGANAATFEGLGIDSKTDQGEAFLRAVSAVQNLSGADKNTAADKLFGGFGTRGLGEFLTGNLGEQAKAIKGIDFNTLARQVNRGSSEQSKITTALTDSATQKLLLTDLDSSLITSKIANETQRVIENSQSSNIADLATSADTIKTAVNSLSVTVAKGVNAIATSLKFFTGGNNIDIEDALNTNSNVISD